MKLYHSTYVANLASIKKYGLGAKQPKNWDISIPGVVCFTKDPEVAFSFCESAEEVCDTKYYSGIVVLEIDSKYLIKKNTNTAILRIDRNIHDDLESFEYEGIINTNLLKLITRSGKRYNLMDLKRYPRYED